MTAWWRFLLLVLATAITINLAVRLIRPAMPFIVGLMVAFVAFNLLRWWRNRL